MSSSRLQIGLSLQIMIAHPRAPGEPEPRRQHASSVSRFLRREPVADTKWPSAKLILPAHDDSLGFPAKRCVWKVCDVLATGGFPVACHYPLNPRRGDPITSEMSKSNTAVVTGRNGCQYRTWNDPEAFHSETPQDRYWFITHELGVTERVRKELSEDLPVGYRWYCIGVQTPFLSDQRPEGLGDLSLLGSVAQELKSALKIWTNNFCGLSITVSKADGELTNVTAKKVAALVSLLEKPLFSKFFDPRRVTDNQVCFISTRSRIAGGEWGHSKEDSDSKPIVRNLANRQSKVKAEGGDGLHILLYRILTQVDIQALHDGLRQTNGAQCSFHVTTDGVIEFSYPEASLEPEYVAVWVDIAKRIVEIAMESEQQYEKTLGGLIDLRAAGREMGWINYWDALGVRDKRDDGNRMWWVKSIANGYRGRERLNGVQSL